MIEVIFLSVLGSIFLVMGFLAFKKQKIFFIRHHYYKNIKKSDLVNYTRHIGQGYWVMGIGCIATGLINFATKTAIGWIVFAVFYIVGVVIFLKTQKKYNGTVNRFK